MTMDRNGTMGVGMGVGAGMGAAGAGAADIASSDGWVGVYEIRKITHQMYLLHSGSAVPLQVVH